MTERREYAPSQALMAMTDEFVALNWLAGLGSMQDEELLEMYWDVINRTCMTLRGPTGSDRQEGNRAALEMLRRVDNGTFPAPALPDNVYKTWCRIMWRKPPSNWEVDCGNACEVAEPYGWVPEAGCPVHDADLDDEMCARYPGSCAECSLVQCKSNPSHKQWMDDSSGIKISDDDCVQVSDTDDLDDAISALADSCDFKVTLRTVDNPPASSLASKPPAETRCGIVLLLGKLAAVADSYTELLPLTAARRYSARDLAQLAIRASTEIEEDNNCLGLGRDCERCAKWEPQDGEV